MADILTDLNLTTPADPTIRPAPSDVTSDSFWQKALDAARWGLSEPSAPGGIGELAKDPNPPPGPAPGTLSDGVSSIGNVADYKTPQELQWAMDKGEAALTQKKLAEAQQTKAPVYTAGKIYTPDGGVYPNTNFGNAQVWARRNVGPGAAEALAGAGRSVAGAVAPGLDFMSSGFNIARHHLADKTAGGFFRAAPEQAEGAGNDIPLASQGIQSGLGIPGQTAETPAWQRVLEGAASGYGAGLLKSGVTRALERLPGQGVPGLGTRTGVGTVAPAAGKVMPALEAISPQIPAILKNLTYSAAGEGLARAGEYIGDPFGVGDILSYAGGALGSGMVPFRKGFINWAGSLAPKKADIPAVPAEQGRSADYQQYLERTSPHQNIGDAPDIARALDAQNIPSNFSTLSGPMGQRLSKILGSLMFIGAPTDKANMRTEDAVQARVRDAAESVAGPLEIPREGPSKGYIGGLLTQGAGHAVRNIDDNVREIYQPISEAMRGVPVDLTRTVTRLREGIASGEWPEAARARLEQIADELAANSPGGNRPGATGYDEAARGPAPDLPSPTVTGSWPYAQRTRRDIRQAVGTPEISTSGQEALVGSQGPNPKREITQAQREAADAHPDLTPGQFDRARTETSRLQRLRDIYTELTGERVGTQAPGPGHNNPPPGPLPDFPNPAKEETAYNRIHENRQNPSAIRPFTDPAYPELFRRGAFGAYLATLGQSPEGQFRSEYLAKQLHPRQMDPDVLDMLTEHGSVPGQAGGAPTTAGQTIRDLRTIGANTTTPTSRFGLASTLGVSAGVAAALKAAGYAAAPLTYGMSRTLESPAMREALLGRPAAIANDVFGGLARAGAREEQRREPLIVPVTPSRYGGGPAR